MDIFNRKRKDAAPFGGIKAADAFRKPYGYDDALEYLVGLSDEDFKKVCDVAAIYRRADQETSALLGKEAKPTTFIDPPSNEELVPAHVNHKDPMSFLDDDDDIADVLDLSNLNDDEPAVDNIKRKRAKS